MKTVIFFIHLFQINRAFHIRHQCNPAVDGNWIPKTSNPSNPTTNPGNAETNANYDCSMFPLASFLPTDMDYTKVMPFCERLTDQTKVAAIPLKSSQLEWNPNPSCSSYNQFDAQEFANVLAERTLYIMGDSTSEEQWISLICLLGKHVVDIMQTKSAVEQMKSNAEEDWTNFEYTSNKLQRKRGILHLRGGGKIVWIRTNTLVSEVSGVVEDQLVKIERVSKDYIWTELELPWTYLFSSDVKNTAKDDVILFNSGAHLNSTAMAKKTAKNFLKWISIHFDGTVIYRKNVPGSQECQTLYKDQISSLNWNWKNFKEFDNIFVSMSKRFLPEMKLLDVREMSMARPDVHPGLVFGHVDCLHFCLPFGPVDVWNRLLYNMIK